MTHSIRQRISKKGRPLRSQRGAATLIVVMVLFFVLAMVAGYTSKNIIFEQRISSNLYQATVSMEAAEAGMEWALGMLNGSLVDNQCQPVEDLSTPTPPTSQTFRNRYLVVDPSTGFISVPAAVRDGPRQPSCTLNSDGSWQCSCPSSAGAGPTLVGSTSSALAPSFRVRFVQIREPLPTNPGLVRIEVNGCTALDESCLSGFKPANPAFCRASLCSTVALAGGLKTAPVAAFTARGSFDLSGAAATLVNGVVGGTSLTIVAGGAVLNQAALNLHGIPGVAAASTVVAADPGLANPLFDGNRMFAAFFGVWPTTFNEQPGLVTINCGGGCNASTVRSAWTLHPGRPMLLLGNLTLDGGLPIGSPASPVLIVTTGNVGFSSATDVYGLVYSRAATWNTSGSGRIIGAGVAENSVGGNANFTVAFDSSVLNALRWTTGTFVRVPGSWADFQ